MKRSHLLFVVSIITMFSTICISAAEIYKWVDADGNTYYADIPPTSTSSEQVRVDPSANGGSSIRPQERKMLGQIESQ